MSLIRDSLTVTSLVFGTMACASSALDDGARPDGGAANGAPGNATGPTSDKSGSRSACSTGPAYTFETNFPTVPSIENSLPECTPRCENGDLRSGYGMASTAWKQSALPSGSCTVSGEICQMGAVRTRTCPSGGTSMCSYTGYECRCESGNWRCYSGPPGASACLCALADGGYE